MIEFIHQLDFIYLIFCGFTSIGLLFISMFGKISFRDYWRYPFFVGGIVMASPLLSYLF